MTATISNPAPSTLNDILRKVRRITGRPNQAQIADAEIINYVNTFYIFDMPEHIRLESLRVNFQFVTTANVQVYNFPTSLYLDNMPPLYIGGYQSYFTQSRDNFFRINPGLNYLQQSVAIGNNTTGPYSFNLINTPITPGFPQNPNRIQPANSDNVLNPSQNTYGATASSYNWMVLISGEGVPNSTSGLIPWYSLVDDGQGHLVDPKDASATPTVQGTINYLTGAVVVGTSSEPGFAGVIPQGNPINAQYVPYVASRPQSALFYQDQILLYPIPDQAYTVSFEAYQYPIQFVGTQETGTYIEIPQVREWWQLLAIGAALKIFEDYGDFENIQKYRGLMDEQMRLVLRRTIVQQTSERTASIYSEQSGFSQFPFGNNFSGF